MAINITILEDWLDRGTDIGEDAIVNRRRSYFALVTDDGGPPQRVSDFQIINAFSQQTGIVRYAPWVGADGQVDPTCRCTRLSVKQTDEAIKWEIRLAYSSARASSPSFGGSPRAQRERAAMAREGQGGQRQPPADPSQRPLVIRYGHQEYEEVLEYDQIVTIGGKPQPVWNSARERFVPPATRSVSFRVITLERNELLFDSAFTHNFMNTVNAGTFYGYTAGKVLCKAIDAESDHESGINFFRVTYVFWVRPKSDHDEGWILKLLDQGLNELDSNGKPIAIRDQQTAQPVSSPRPLNGNGLALNPRDTPVYLGFNCYPQSNFALLGLGG